jgi:hypothetical protein
VAPAPSPVFFCFPITLDFGDLHLLRVSLCPLWFQVLVFRSRAITAMTAISAICIPRLFSVPPW